MAAVFAALTIAFIEWRRNRRADADNQRTRTERREALIKEAIGLSTKMDMHWMLIVGKMDGTLGINPKSTVDMFLGELNRARDRLDDLSRFPNDDPQVFIAIVRLVDLCGFEKSLLELSASYLRSIAERRREEIKDVRDDLVGLMTVDLARGSAGGHSRTKFVS